MHVPIPASERPDSRLEPRGHWDLHILYLRMKMDKHLNHRIFNLLLVTPRTKTL
jgi:hypothetical protein